MKIRNIGKSAPTVNRRSRSGTNRGMRPILGLVIARDGSAAACKGIPRCAPDSRTEFPFRTPALCQPLHSNAPEALRGITLAVSPGRPPRRKSGALAEETFCQPVARRAVGRDIHVVARVLLWAAEGLFADGAGAEFLASPGYVGPHSCWNSVEMVVCRSSVLKAT